MPTIMDQPTRQETQQMRVIVSAVAIVTMVGVSLSVLGPLLALEMERWGTPSTLAGLTATIAGLGNILIVALAPRLAARIGVKRLVGLAIIAASLLHFAFWLLPSLIVWALLRFVLGGVIGLLFVLSEFWIASAADPQRRGVIMGAYATALAIGFALGPLILAATGTTGPMPYAVTSVLILFGGLPLFFMGNQAAEIHDQARTTVISFVRLAPQAMLAALAVGAIEIGAFTQLSIHGLRVGLSETSAAMLLTAMAIGNIILQLPIGWLADRMDKPFLMLVIACLATLCAIGLIFAGASILALWGLIIAIGGLVGSLYVVGLAYLAGRFAGADLVSANAAFIILWSVGQMAGPPFVGAGIDFLGSRGLPMSFAVLLGLYALFALWTLRKSSFTR
ncbi:MAG: MFS transporter [Rhabdaerophilum sp.]